MLSFCIHFWGRRVVLRLDIRCCTNILTRDAVHVCAVYATTTLSVCLSVCHTRALCKTVDHNYLFFETDSTLGHCLIKEFKRTTVLFSTDNAN